MRAILLYRPEKVVLAIAGWVLVTILALAVCMCMASLLPGDEALRRLVVEVRLQVVEEETGRPLEGIEAVVGPSFSICSEVWRRDTAEIQASVQDDLMAALARGDEEALFESAWLGSAWGASDPEGRIVACWIRLWRASRNRLEVLVRAPRAPPPFGGIDAVFLEGRKHETRILRPSDGLWHEDVTEGGVRRAVLDFGVIRMRKEDPATRRYPRVDRLFPPVPRRHR